MWRAVELGTHQRRNKMKNLIKYVMFAVVVSVSVIAFASTQEPKLHQCWQECNHGFCHIVCDAR